MITQPSYNMLCGIEEAWEMGWYILRHAAATLLVSTLSSCVSRIFSSSWAQVRQSVFLDSP